MFRKFGNDKETPTLVLNSNKEVANHHCLKRRIVTMYQNGDYVMSLIGSEVTIRETSDVTGETKQIDEDGKNGNDRRIFGILRFRLSMSREDPGDYVERESDWISARSLYITFGIRLISSNRNQILDPCGRTI